MRCLLLAPAFFLSALPLLSQQAATPSPTANAIMARVAANQDSSETGRAHFIYVQHAHVISRKGKTVMCEETTDSRVAPTDKGSHQELLNLDGRLRHKGQYVLYTHLPQSKEGKAEEEHDNDHVSVSTGDDGMDRDLVEGMRNNLTNNKSKDGIGAGLFPLTSKSQADYDFKLVGRESKNGRDCFHLTFQPKQKDDYGWKGDAWIDATAFQPILVRTTMAHNVPFAVRTFLGTSVPGLGFTVTYAPQQEGLWFPETFGTEFKLHVLFFLNREIVIDAHNRDFEKTHSSVTIISGDGATTNPPKTP